MWAFGFKTIRQRVDCKCKRAHYSFKCGSHYCTRNDRKCDLLNMKIKDENEFKKKSPELLKLERLSDEMP